jgi:hypothetical protein
MDIYDLMVEKWPSAIVARSKVEEFSGGLISGSTLANHDCNGTGPRGKFRNGGKVFYLTEKLGDWFRDRDKDYINPLPPTKNKVEDKKLRKKMIRTKPPKRK